MFNKEIWIEGEVLAKEYMKKHGYKILYTNYFCVGIELDIVAILPRSKQIKILKSAYRKKRKIAKTLEEKLKLTQMYLNFRKNLQDLLVITEVKARSSDKFGRGADAVDESKQNNIIRGARYLLEKPEFKDMQVRFDVATIDNSKIEYIENAFSL